MGESKSDLLFQVREEEEWAARDEARRVEVEGLKAELEAVKRVVEGSGGVDGKFSGSCIG